MKSAGATVNVTHRNALSFPPYVIVQQELAERRPAGKRGRGEGGEESGVLG